MTPALYRDIAVPHGVKGAIAIEASPRLDENDWVLETIEKDTIMVGYIGDLEPDKPEYGQYLEKYHRIHCSWESATELCGTGIWAPCCPTRILSPA